MIILQNKIIYVPSIPASARSEKTSDYALECKPVEWEEIPIQSSDGTMLKLLKGCIRKAEKARQLQDVVVLYFQGCVFTGVFANKDC